MRARVLFVSQQLPWPKDSGGNIRTYFMLAGLARRFDVVLCSTRPILKGSVKGSADVAREAERVFGELRVQVQLVDDVKRSGSFGKAAGVLSSLVRGVPAVLRHNDNPPLRQLVQRTARNQRFQSIHLNHVDTAPYFDLAKSPPSVIDSHNLLFEYYGRRADVEPGFLQPWVCAREARLLSQYEPKVFAAAKRVVVCSEDERLSLHQLDPNLDVRVVPNGVDCATFKPASSPPEAASRDLVFVGDLAYGPNRDAVLRFVRDVLPRVRKEEPQARFLAVGKNPSAELSAIGRAQPEVVVTGMVDDVSEWVHQAKVYVVPIRYGSGTRLKVLEAFALGVPTVSTRVGAEGIATTDGEDILLRDEPNEMAQAIVRLLREPELAARLAKNARATVESRYDWPALGEQMANVHAELH